MLTVTLVYEALLLKHLSHKFSDHKKIKINVQQEKYKGLISNNLLE